MKILISMILFFGLSAHAAPKKPVKHTKPVAVVGEPKKKIVYVENQTLDFEGLSLDGELKAPGEFYFQNRNQERFDSLTKRRVHFRREMLRDSVQSN
jgi:hypothetical protein